MQFPVDARLRDETPVRLFVASREDYRPLRQLYDVIVEEGCSYPHDRPLTEDQFLEYWIRAKSTVVAYAWNGSSPRELAGAFYLKPNWPGRARQVANAGFIVAPQWRNRGLGWLLGATMLDYAKQLGFRQVIFNLVFAENLVARRLWAKLGFQEMAVLLKIVRKNDGTYQDAVIMFRSLL